MADIAILFAEEYERSVRNARKAGGTTEGVYEIDLVSYASAFAQRLKTKNGQKRIELGNWVREPKTQIGLAASNGFFSA